MTYVPPAQRQAFMQAAGETDIQDVVVRRLSRPQSVGERAPGVPTRPVEERRSSQVTREFTGHKRFNLTLYVVDPEFRDRFRSLSRPESFYEIRPNRRAGQVGAYSVEMTYEEYVRATQDVDDPKVNLISITEDQVFAPQGGGETPGTAAMNYINALVVEDQVGYTGRGVVLGIIDWGISEAAIASHLSGQLINSRGFGVDTFNGHRHGGMMAGAAVPPEARFAFGAAQLVSTATAAIYWLVDDVGIHILSISLAAPNADTTLEDAVKHAREQGVVVFASAGNSGGEPTNTAAGTNQVFYPGRYDAANAITNFRPSTDQKAFTSNYGTQVFMAAPGCEVYLVMPDGTLEYWDDFGTSTATAIAARACAMWMSTGITAIQAEAKMVANARVTGAGAQFEGAGVVNFPTPAPGDPQDPVPPPAPHIPGNPPPPKPPTSTTQLPPTAPTIPQTGENLAPPSDPNPLDRCAASVSGVGAWAPGGELTLAQRDELRALVLDSTSHYAATYVEARLKLEKLIEDAIGQPLPYAFSAIYEEVESTQVSQTVCVSLASSTTVLLEIVPQAEAAQDPYPAQGYSRGPRVITQEGVYDAADDAPKAQPGAWAEQFKIWRVHDPATHYYNLRRKGPARVTVVLAPRVRLLSPTDSLFPPGDPQVPTYYLDLRWTRTDIPYEEEEDHLGTLSAPVFEPNSNNHYQVNPAGRLEGENTGSDLVDQGDPAPLVGRMLERIAAASNTAGADIRVEVYTRRSEGTRSYKLSPTEGQTDVYAPYTASSFPAGFFDEYLLGVIESPFDGEDTVFATEGADLGPAELVEPPPPLPPLTDDPEPGDPIPAGPTNIIQEPEKLPTVETNIPTPPGGPPTPGEPMQVQPPLPEQPPIPFQPEQIKQPNPPLDPCNNMMPGPTGGPCGPRSPGESPSAPSPPGSPPDSPLGPPAPPPGNVDVVGPSVPPGGSKYFSEDKCYKDALVLDIIDELAGMLGMDPSTVVTDQACTERYTGCFLKGTSIFDALKKMANLCGGVFVPDPGGGGVITPPGPNNVHHYLHEDENVFYLVRVYENLDFFHRVEVFRPPLFRNGQIAVPAVSKPADIDSPFQRGEDIETKVIYNYDWNLTEAQIQNLANVEAGKISGTGAKCEVRTLYKVGQNYKLYDQLHLQRPSINWYTNWKIVMLEHSFTQQGHLTIAQATWLNNDTPPSGTGTPLPPAGAGAIGVLRDIYFGMHEGSVAV